MKHSLLITSFMTSALAIALTACGDTQAASPAPVDNPAKSAANNDGKVDKVKVKDIQTYSHPDFFYMNTDGHMVFTAPNKATTTPNSSNTRSELRYMSRGSNTKIKTHDRAGNPDRPAAFSAVIGQIHAIKDKPQSGAFGYGNEPLKIYFKKYPDHDTGSVFWNYERNLAKADPNRTDIAYPVWGNIWTNTDNPGSAGIPLGQELSYVVNVHKDVMHLEFSTPGKPTVKYKINLADNVDANGKVDAKDNPKGYEGDAHYFKAGIYNQCSTKDAPGVWYAACPGTGIWATDKANGDYAQATFSRLVVTDAEPM